MKDSKGKQASEKERLKQQLEALKVEHRNLDDMIVRLTEQPLVNQVQVQRLKKQSLRLKEMIDAIENKLLPDIIA